MLLGEILSSLSGSPSDKAGLIKAAVYLKCKSWFFTLICQIKHPLCRVKDVTVSRILPWVKKL